MIVKRMARSRRGSALLVCTIAAAVISFVVLALARTTQVSHLDSKTNYDAAVACATAEGLYHRAKADFPISGRRRSDRTANPMITEASYVVVRNAVSGADEVQVLLYRAAPVPFIVRPLN
jgi:Tfp pilus assembly protein PilX